MDSLSVVASIGALTATCLKTTIALNTLNTNNHTSNPTLETLCQNCAKVGTALPEIQSLILQNTDIKNNLELIRTLDTTLMACITIFLCLDREVNTNLSPQSSSQAILQLTKSSSLQGEIIKEYLTRVEDLRSALAFLMALFQIRSKEDVDFKIRDHTSRLQALSKAARSLAFSNPEIRIPSPAFEFYRERDSVLRDARPMSIHALLDDTSSIEDAPPEYSVVDSRSPGTMSNVRDTHDDLLTGSQTPGSFPTVLCSSSGMGVPLPDIPPLKIFAERLQFIRPFSSLTSIPVRFLNPNNFDMAFKVFTTAPKQYCVRPVRGIIGPGQDLSVDFKFKSVPAEREQKECKDRFQIRWALPIDSKEPEWLKLKKTGLKRILVDWV